MKTEKRASVLSFTASNEELTLYSDKRPVKLSSAEPCDFVERISSSNSEQDDDYDTFASSSDEPISYDLNAIDIDAIAAVAAVAPASQHDYHHRQTIEQNYEFDYAKTSTEIHDLILKSE